MISFKLLKHISVDKSGYDQIISGCETYTIKVPGSALPVEVVLSHLLARRAVVLKKAKELKDVMTIAREAYFNMPRIDKLVDEILSLSSDVDFQE